MDLSSIAIVVVSLVELSSLITDPFITNIGYNGYILIVGNVGKLYRRYHISLIENGNARSRLIRHIYFISISDCEMAS